MTIFWCDIGPWEHNPTDYQAFCQAQRISLNPYLSLRESIPHVVSQALVRRLWPESLGPFPGISTSAQGKPRYYCDNPPYFNVSHSGQLVVIAMNHTPLGVDIEEIVPLDPSLLEALHPVERKYLLSLPVQQQERTFFRIWTRKESFLKATGDGLGGFFDLAPIVSASGEWTSEIQGVPIRDIDLFPGYAAAVSCTHIGHIALHQVPLCQLINTKYNTPENLFSL